MAFVFERRTGPGLGTFGQEGELIYVTSQGSQLTVEALELALESFAQPCFCMSCECDFFWHGESMDRNHSACFRKPFLLVCRSVGPPFGRTARTSE